MGERSRDSVSARAEEIVASALECREEEREGFVAAECDGDANVAREVESLLAGHASPALSDELDAYQAARLVEGTVGESVEGWRLGPYRLVREIGRGGMGAVYLAERADGAFEQQVALKLIKRGMDSEAILERFLRERQILAGLEHPNIAHLLDGGVAEDGRPYLVMEHVPGRTLLDYCEEEGVDLDGRLDLFAEVCRAVQHAHRNLVVHRDLKPSNVLVTEKGRVKLLDFGVAKLLDESGDALATALTQAGAAGLTPQYAAPEQVRGEAVTTATDVYALGLMLYELLTGELPYVVEADDAERVICDTEPTPPSRALAAEDSDARRIRRRLQDDLDTIILKALRKEPERRYASAEALLADIQRHRGGLPVRARPDRVSYRVAKFLGRHKVGVGAVCVAAMFLIGLVAALAVGQARAAREAERAEQTRNFLIDMFEFSDPDVSKGRTVTARQMLDAGAARVDSELAGQPDLQAEMMGVIGGIYVKLGLYDEAGELLERALEVRRAGAQGAWSSRRGEIQSLLDLGAVLYNQGDYDGAVDLYRDALAIAERHYRPPDLVAARALDELSVALRAKRELEEAESLARRGLGMRRALLGEEHADVAASWMNLGVVEYLQGDFSSAEEHYQRALALRIDLFGESNLQVADSLNRLGILQRNMGRLDEAELTYQRTLEIYRQLFDGPHPLLANTLGNLAVVHISSWDYASAEPLLRESLAMQRDLLGDRHPGVARALENLAFAMAQQGSYAQAESLAREVLSIRREALGDEHPLVARAQRVLGFQLSKLGRHEEALSLLRQSVAIHRQRFADDRMGLQDALTSLANGLAERGDYVEAEALLREALTIALEIVGDDHDAVRAIRASLGAALLAQGRAGEAEDVLSDLVHTAKESPEEWRRHEAMSLYGASLAAGGDLERGREFMTKGLRGLEKTRGTDSPVTARARQRRVEYRDPP